MLRVLRVFDMATIERAELEFGDGLNVITGETGAGKSLLVGALQLLRGARARGDVVRAGAREAVVEALFERDGADDGELVVRRVVGANGRTRAYANGRLVTLAELRALVGGLVDVAGQHEAHGLSDPSTHLALLDAFGGLGALAARVAAAVERWRAAESALEAARSALEGRIERQDLLRYQLSEVDLVEPRPGEDVELEARAARLRHAAELRGAVAAALDAVAEGDRSAVDRVGRAASALAEAARRDPEAAPLADRLRVIELELGELGRDLASYAARFEEEGEALDVVEERLAAVRRLVRKHGGSIEAVLEWRDRARAELAELDGAEERVAELESRARRLRAEAEALARELSARRREAAGRLGRAVGRQLARLAMPHARLEVALRPVPGGAPARHGRESAELLLAANPGEAPAPLRSVASGGERSRALLAIKVALAAAAPPRCWVMDEVDAGTGGAVADVVGRKLAALARRHQVVCVTHLPQVAAWADHHFRVEKRVRDGRARTVVTRLDAEGRRDEIARMIAGARVTPTARAAAGELVRHARAV